MSTPHTPPRVAVLGGTGFIGRAVTARFQALGSEVLTLARKPSATPVAGRFVPFDLTSAPASELAALLERERTDVVVNAAGGMWGLDDEQMHTANVVLVDRLVEAIGSTAAPARLVHLGTVHEYGLVPVGVSQHEDDVPAPVMAYGRLKLEATERVVSAVRSDGLDAVVLRLGNVTGAGQPGHSLLGVMGAKLAAARAAGEVAELSLAPLTAQRDFVDLDDTVDAIVSAAGTRTARSVLNIGTGSAAPARRLVDLLVEVSGVPVTVTEVPAPEGTGPESEWQQLDISAAREQLGWVPQRTLRQSVESLWADRLNG
ncbi:NAD-dependent epimerase/dehydratase family protein [Kitasatospora sp. DSM 101779]|uniref:NAD-dependent epimerase/dehydratase family protein n=1 Tax=Kitasatospora sp. DSM 101779 TaxID=2853165 RepID=UPI0021D81778|nr:NAD(P)-dependent oxidoreductase [Kitasatospora sp. DSM 101779]MCU7824278.1 NAD(P)-dependent oxidoreductase [Kitasatospora sp. DSM 101779]